MRCSGEHCLRSHGLGFGKLPAALVNILLGNALRELADNSFLSAFRPALASGSNPRAFAHMSCVHDVIMSHSNA